MPALSRRLIQTFTETISKQVEHFNKTEVERLIQDFNVLLGEPSKPGQTIHGLDRTQFRNILDDSFGIADEMILDRVFRTFDKDNDGVIGLKEWVEGLAIFLRGSLDEKMRYCFFVYDLNGDQYISKEEMFQLLMNSLSLQTSEEDPDEGIKDLVELTLKKMDLVHDGRVSFAEFENAVREENLWLEAFGICLPDTLSIAAFQQRVFRK